MRYQKTQAGGSLYASLTAREALPQFKDSFWLDANGRKAGEGALVGADIFASYEKGFKDDEDKIAARKDPDHPYAPPIMRPRLERGVSVFFDACEEAIPYPGNGPRPHTYAGPQTYRCYRYRSDRAVEDLARLSEYVKKRGGAGLSGPDWERMLERPQHVGEQDIAPIADQLGTLRHEAEGMGVRFLAFQSDFSPISTLDDLLMRSPGKFLPHGQACGYGMLWMTPEEINAAAEAERRDFNRDAPNLDVQAFFMAAQDFLFRMKWWEIGDIGMLSLHSCARRGRKLIRGEKIKDVGLFYTWDEARMKLAELREEAAKAA